MLLLGKETKHLQLEKLPGKAAMLIPSVMSDPCKPAAEAVELANV